MTPPNPADRAAKVAVLRFYGFYGAAAMLEADQAALDALEAALAAANEDAARLSLHLGFSHTCDHPCMDAHRQRIASGADQ